MIRMYGVSFYVLCNLVDVEGHVRTVAVWRKQSEYVLPHKGAQSFLRT